MNKLNAMIHITDPETTEILFMNDHMKQHYGTEGYVIGRTCYKLLQDNQNIKCGFCPCHQLDNDPDKVIEWEQTHIPQRRQIHIWLDGRTVHLQHSVDITELTKAKEMSEHELNMEIEDGSPLTLDSKIKWSGR